MVEAITAQEVDFAQWYTDICTKAELVEYSSVKGFVVLRPYGYAIWENIQKNLDSRFKATGHENVAMPVLIPESLLKKEGELVNGFAPEVDQLALFLQQAFGDRRGHRHVLVAGSLKTAVQVLLDVLPDGVATVGAAPQSPLRWSTRPVRPWWRCQYTTGQSRPPVR